MRPIELMKFLRQFTVLVQRNLRLIWNDKLLLASLILQAPFMVFVIKLVVDPNCFTSNLVNVGSRTALFILSAMAAFMGTLNSYREICKERDIILREASVGVSLGAVVLSKAFVLLLIEIVQGFILTFGFVNVVHIPQNHLLFETNLEIFVTVLLMLFASGATGLLVSALFKSGETAILVVLVIMIGQVVFSGIMFTLTGAANVIANIIVCRWGMGALGASTDLNSRLAWLKAGFDGPMYDATIANLLHCWQMLGLIAVVCILAAWLVLQISFTRKKA
ncbi:ABC transporter permease [Subdoligranulum variabile]|nr:ABC transporter permease [Subdoligranulum variabile]UWP69123.1 ABC transporter permease [Subdoligranulum variabile]